MEFINYDILQYILQLIPHDTKISLLTTNRYLCNYEYPFYSIIRYKTEYRLIVPRIYKTFDVININKNYLKYSQIHLDPHMNLNILTDIHIPNLLVEYDMNQLEKISTVNLEIFGLHMYNNLSNLIRPHLLKKLYFNKCHISDNFPFYLLTNLEKLYFDSMVLYTHIKDLSSTVKYIETKNGFIPTFSNKLNTTTLTIEHNSTYFRHENECISTDFKNINLHVSNLTKNSRFMCELIRANIIFENIKNIQIT